MRNKRGEYSIFNIFTFMIMAIVAVVFLGGLIYGQGLIYKALQDVGTQNEANAGQPGYTNMTYANESTFGVLNQGIQALKMVALVIILCTAASIIITNFLVRIHPLFFFVHILISLLAVIFSAPISNAYYSLLQSGIYDGGLAGFTAANWIVLHLPPIVLVISVLGGIGIFLNLIRSGGEQTL